MDISGVMIYFILNKTCLDELILEYSFHVPVFHVIVNRWISGARHTWKQATALMKLLKRGCFQSAVKSPTRW